MKNKVARFYGPRCSFVSNKLTTDDKYQRLLDDVSYRLLVEFDRARLRYKSEEEKRRYKDSPSPLNVT